VTLFGTPRGRISVLWNTTPESRSFDQTAILSSATLVDQRGNSRLINAVGGAYALRLPGATANWGETPQDYIIGGEPYLVIEADTVPPTAATVDPLPETTYGNAILVSWGAADAEAGIWGFEVQAQRDGGTWTDWLDLAETAGETSALYTDGEDGETYCFRARAWDRAGNLGPWSDVGRCTTLRLAREVRVGVGSIFGDEDRNGDRGDNEPLLADVTFRLVDQSGLDVLAPSVGSSWAFTITLAPGEYALLVTPSTWPSAPPGWLPRRLPVSVRTGDGSGPLEVDLPAMGLLPHRASSFFPLVARSR
jgi:hypothetical protein